MAEKACHCLRCRLDMPPNRCPTAATGMAGLRADPGCAYAGCRRGTSRHAAKGFDSELAIDHTHAGEALLMTSTLQHRIYRDVR